MLLTAYACMVACLGEKATAASVAACSRSTFSAIAGSARAAITFVEVRLPRLDRCFDRWQPLPGSHAEARGGGEGSPTKVLRLTQLEAALRLNSSPEVLKRHYRRNKRAQIRAKMRQLSSRFMTVAYGANTTPPKGASPHEVGGKGAGGTPPPSGKPGGSPAPRVGSPPRTGTVATLMITPERARRSSWEPTPGKASLSPAAERRGILRNPFEAQRERAAALESLERSFFIFNESQSGALSPDEVLHVLRCMVSEDAPTMGERDALDFIADHEGTSEAEALSLDGFISGMVALTNEDEDANPDSSVHVAAAAEAVTEAIEAQRTQALIARAGLAERQQAMLAQGIEEEEVERQLLDEIADTAAGTARVSDSADSGERSAGEKSGERSGARSDGSREAEEGLNAPVSSDGAVVSSVTRDLLKEF